MQAENIQGHLRLAPSPAPIMWTARDLQFNDPGENAKQFLKHSDAEPATSSHPEIGQSPCSRQAEIIMKKSKQVYN